MAGDLYTAILSECRTFARNEIRPDVLDSDLAPDFDRVRRIWEKSAELDLPSLCIPENHNGIGLPIDGCAMVVDLLATECAAIAVLFAGHFAACSAMSAADADRQKKLFDKLAGGTTIAAPILPSRLSGDPPFMISSKGKRTLSGQTPPIMAAKSAGGFLVFAADRGKTACTALWIDATAPGVSVGDSLKLPGLKAVPCAPVFFDQVDMEGVIDLGQSDAAGKQVLASAERAFYGFTAAAAMGCARKACEQARDYAGQRYQSGDVIIHHQEIQRMLGHMQMQIKVGTAAYLDLFSNGTRASYHVPDAALTKAFCTDAALSIIQDSIQIHGGYGYMHDYGIEKRMRDVRVLQSMGETNPYLMVRHIAESL